MLNKHHKTKVFKVAFKNEQVPYHIGLLPKSRRLSSLITQRAAWISDRGNGTMQNAAARHRGRVQNGKN
jgi:hypothetical protein